MASGPVTRCNWIARSRPPNIGSMAGWRDPAKIVNAMSVSAQRTVSWAGARQGQSGPSPDISILAPIHSAVVMRRIAPTRCKPG